MTQDSTTKRPRGLTVEPTTSSRQTQKEVTRPPARCLWWTDHLHHKSQLMPTTLLLKHAHCPGGLQRTMAELTSPITLWRSLTVLPTTGARLAALSEVFIMRSLDWSQTRSTTSESVLRISMAFLMQWNLMSQSQPSSPSLCQILQPSQRLSPRARLQ